MPGHVVNHTAQASLKLADLKKRKFTPAGRPQRIATSLAALNAPPAIELSAAEWKSIAEEVEEGD